MAKTTKTSKTTKHGTTSITKGEAFELVDQVVRQAVSQQARDLEKHFRDIHERLVKLENNK